MAFSRIQSVFTYQTSNGGETWLYDIILDSQGKLGVRNIRGPYGFVSDSLTQVPSVVVDDINEAMDQAQLLVDESEVTSGTANFSGQTQRAVAIPPGLLNNVQYRVHVTTPDGVALRVENQTTTGFTLVATSAYGAVADVKAVSWAVYVSTMAASTLGGTETFVFADNSRRTVAFPATLPSSKYRVLLEPSDFFPVRVENQARTGFDIVIGIEMQDNGESVTVGYDVIA